MMSKPILILYGTVTGNAEYCADKAAKAARQRGYDPTTENLADAAPEVLAEFPVAIIITSTYGDGEPPDGTEDFHRAVCVARRVKVQGLRYAVLGLGDTSYDQFCKIARDYDEALEAAGGERFHARLDCDTDFDGPTDEWIESAFDALAEVYACQPA